MEELLKGLNDSIQRMAIAVETLVGELVRERTAREFEKEKQQISQQTQSPKCSICGRDMRLSKNGKSWQCIDSKPKNVNGKWINEGCPGYIVIK